MPDALAANPEENPWRWKLPLSLVVALVAAALYLPALGNEFVYDDVAQIVIDDYLHNPAHFVDVLTFRSMGMGILDNNRPVNVASLMLDALLWGRRPLGYHLTNLLLHAACAWMVFQLSCRLLAFVPPPRPGRSARGSRRPAPAAPPAVEPRWILAAAAIAGFLMAVHPVNSETVCVPSYREDLLVPFFVLLALLLAGRFPTGRGGADLALGGAIVLLALLASGAKETGVAAAPILFVYWLVFRRRDGHTTRWALLVAAATAVTLAFIAARFFVVPKVTVISSSPAPFLGKSLVGTLPFVPIIWLFQLRHVALPAGLCADYTTDVVRDLGVTPWVAFFAVVLIVFLIVQLARKSPAAALGAGVLLLALLPVSSLAPMFRPIADRYLYFPMAGVALMAGGAVVTARRYRPTRLAVPAILAVVLIPLALVTLKREAVWRNAYTLWSDTLATAPDSFTAADNLAFAAYDRGEISKAVDLWNLGIALTGTKMAEMHAGLSLGLEAQGKHSAADAALRRAAELDPAYAHPDRLVERLRWEHSHADQLEVIARRIRGGGLTTSPASRP